METKNVNQPIIQYFGETDNAEITVRLDDVSEMFVVTTTASLKENGEEVVLSCEFLTIDDACTHAKFLSEMFTAQS
jgi:hypothetical protein